MKKLQEKDPLSVDIERALRPGQFIPEHHSGCFVETLEQIKARLDTLVADGAFERAARLFEVFLQGCYDKAEEMDDSSGTMGMFFETLFVAWIDARQKAGLAAEETVRQICNWMKNDDYGFCDRIEHQVAKILDKEGLARLKSHFEEKFETGFKPFGADRPKCVHDYPWSVRRPAEILKNIYIAKKEIRAYQALCEKIGISPSDCEAIAKLYEGKRRLADALSWAEKGLSLETQGTGGNGSCYGLRFMREELLKKSGRTAEAFESAWAAFQKDPSAYRFANVMKYANRSEAARWRDEALKVAKAASLDAFIEVGTGTKEWKVLAEHIDLVAREEIERLSHYVTERTAKGLARKHPSAAAKVYCALGTRIVKAGKSKYYRDALDYFREAKRLAERSGNENLWQGVVDEIHTQHSRKYGFLADFEKIVAG